MLPAQASPEPRAAEILSALAARVRSLGRYDAAFTVSADDHTVDGYYAVDGERYYIRMGDAEVYCDGKVRYEVNNRTKEIAADAVDTSSRNILDNPTRAFDLAGDEFSAELLSERDGRAAVQLTPKNRSAVSAVTVTVDTHGMRPLSLEYDFDGDRIRIGIHDLKSSAAAPKAFDRTKYAAYELIDFR